MNSLIDNRHLVPRQILACADMDGAFVGHDCLKGACYFSNSEAEYELTVRLDQVAGYLCPKAVDPSIA